MNQPPLQIDIVSDVVCPWCLVGYQQLKQAIDARGVEVNIRWHPFELNPQMADDGENLNTHLISKYGLSQEQLAENRQRLNELANSLGFPLSLSDDSRIVNTFAAHQLIHWANTLDQAGALKLGLFKAYFTEQRDISQHSVLTDVAEGCGLDRETASSVLESGKFVDAVRAEQQVWTDRGITSVPSIVFANRYLTNGAQGPENYGAVIDRVLEGGGAS